MNILKCENLSYVYSPKTPFEKTALDNVSLEIEKGECLGIIGQTGSGKSTLIKHFNGLLTPSSGNVFFNDQNIFQDKKVIKNLCFKVGMVFQYPEYQLFEETVYKDIAFGPINMGLDENQVKEKIKQACYFVGIKDSMLEKSPFEISGGQKRRVAIAGVFAMDPEVIILDEPAAGLDPKGRNKIFSQIKEYQQANNKTVIIVSHSMEDIANFANKVVVVNDSKIAMYDTTENVFARSDELIKMRLSVPQITKVFMGLKNKGLDIPSNVYTLPYAKEKLLKTLKP